MILAFAAGLVIGAFLHIKKDFIKGKIDDILVKLKLK
jgi:uncharacterized metal-binding protein